MLLRPPATCLKTAACRPAPNSGLGARVLNHRHGVGPLLLDPQGLTARIQLRRPLGIRRWGSKVIIGTNYSSNPKSSSRKHRIHSIEAILRMFLSSLHRHTGGYVSNGISAKGGRQAPRRHLQRFSNGLVLQPVLLRKGFECRDHLPWPWES